MQCIKPDIALFPYIADVYTARSALARTVRQAGEEPDEGEQAEIDELENTFQRACEELTRLLRRADVSTAQHMRPDCQLTFFQVNRGKMVGTETTPRRARPAGAAPAPSNPVDSVTGQKIARSLRALVEVKLHVSVPPSPRLRGSC